MPPKQPTMTCHDLLQNHHETSTASCFAQVSQATPRENTPALRGSISSAPPRESSGASSGPPSPWGSGKTKKRIVDAMKNELSDIHLLIGDETTTGCGINYARIQKMYAPKQMSIFFPNFKQLIESKKNMTGPFKEIAKKSEPGCTSIKKTSLGYTLLHDKYLKQSSIINLITAEELWKSQPQFQKFKLNNFKKYNKNMKKMVSNKVTHVATEEAIYQEDMQQHLQKHKTCRGTPFLGQTHS